MAIDNSDDADKEMSNEQQNICLVINLSTERTAEISTVVALIVLSYVSRNEPN